MTEKNQKNNNKIDKIEITNDTLTSRGGLFLFVRYISKLGILSIFEKFFGYMRKSNKGKSIPNIFKQILCYFIDGTSFTLTRFDALFKDKGYTAIIENEVDEMCSSHSIKRFFQAFSLARIWLFRKILLTLFIWRLRIEKPEVIKLGIDTMVLDNDEALKRQGVEPTYKKKKGFQPLQMTWGRYLIDAIFRSGKKHSNYSNHVVKMVRTVVKKIRLKYREDVPIVLRADSGFFDENNFKAFEELRILYVAGGKIYNDIKEFVSDTSEEYFASYENKNNIWDFIEFGDRRGTWKNFRRAIFMSPRREGEQLLLAFARPDTVIYTNIGTDEELTKKLIEICGNECMNPEWSIEEYHARGADELVHKGLKDFGTEQLPFYQFKANAAFYYLMVIAFNLFESYKYDVTNDIVPVKSLAKTLRRLLIDFAAKVVYHSKQIIVKVTDAVYNQIDIEILWEQCNSPPVISMI